jgi:RNA recognition motif-containing protein
LSYDVSEQDLQELFKGLGPVRNVEIVYNRSTHRSKGYGFIEMVNRDEAMRAVEVLHDQFFMGRKLVVSGAKSKGQDEREDQEARSERPARPVVLAPLPATAPAAAAAPAAVVAPSIAAADSEPTIQTIVETVTPLVEAPIVEAPVVEPSIVEAPAEIAVIEEPAPQVAAEISATSDEETSQRQA